MKKAVFNWSGGKDSALALQHILSENQYEVIALITTMDENTGKSFLHGIPKFILEKQAESIGIPLYTIEYALEKRNYEEKYLEAINQFKSMDVTAFIFGDIHLSNVRTYRESKLNPLGIEVVEPLWNQSSEQVISNFLKSGIQSTIVVTQSDKLERHYIGKLITQQLIDSFPAGIDPCGENGEYHSLSFAGGPFKYPIEFNLESIQEIAYDVNLANGETTQTYFWVATIS